jgi:ubiquitin-conjugating enzyme E2 J2
MTSVCFKRLQKELVAIQKNPVEHISTTPNENNLLEWHYVIEGPTGSVYEGGFYHGVLRFPKEYPYKPPSILMFTRNGRFKQNVRLCLSMSDYHPESWNPMWSVSSILSGLMSFMLDSQPTLGSMEASDDQRKQYARESLNENLKNPVFRKLFPQYAKLGEQRKSESRQERSPSQGTADNGNFATEGAAAEDGALQEAQAPVDGENGNGPARRVPRWRKLAFVAGTTAVTAAAIVVGFFLNTSHHTNREPPVQ